ncbi:hypothetical protein [Streptomyces sp. NBC_01373]|uniref:hypothetical protein n=1 Tax=Streptomyces sp. NBC_01373 TaxID=2903843 RepID=UPI002251987A|nr:hypothetical protein [Streptomyces sp. NBC_01373]MCX4703183.1 hypothetical protein [Streptomyces sp. NBC_01373]
MTDSGGRTTFLTCYADLHDYGWHHVDLFVHDEAGKEINWVHWQVEEDGPDAADRATARVEPALRRTGEWEHGIRADGSSYWTAQAAWDE